MSGLALSRQGAKSVLFLMSEISLQWAAHFPPKQRKIPRAVLLDMSL